MDDIIQVIVALFVIWSFIGSAFKKKPEEKPKPVRKQQRSSNTKPKMEYTAKDVIDELLGMKLPRTEEEFPTYKAPNKYEQDYDVNKSLESETASLEKKKSKFDREIPDIDFDKLSSLESNSKIKRVKTEATKQIVVAARSSDIKSKFKNSTSIKDAIIISEILSKPKALRVR